jgi:hypothetical protein
MVSSERAFAALPCCSIHIGSDDQAKGPPALRLSGPSRDFAVVLAQTSVAEGYFGILSAYSIK